MIFFEDSSKIILEREVKVSAWGNDSYQLSVIYDIDEILFNKFKTTKIKYFQIHNYLHEFDKWPPKNIQEAFIKIELEKYK